MNATKTVFCAHRCAFRLQHGMQAVQPQWQLLVSSLPEKVDTPVLWSPNEQTELLQGSAALQEAQSRMQALDAEWQSIAEQMKTTSQGPAQGVLCSLHTTFWNHRVVRKTPCLSVAAHGWRILHACHTGKCMMPDTAVFAKLCDHILVETLVAFLVIRAIKLSN